MPSSTLPLASVLFVASLFSVGANAGDVDLSKPVLQVARKVPQPLDSVAQGQSVDFTTWQSSIEVNDVVGKFEYGLFCTGGVSFLYSKDADNWFSASLGKKYREAAVRLGVRAANDARSVFDDKKGAAAFQLGATLLAWDYRVCRDDGEVKGQAYARIKWEVFSSRRQKVVYSTTIEASHAETSRVLLKKFDGDFLEAIVDNLFADPKLVEVIKSGGNYDDQPRQAYEPLKLDVGRTVAGGVSHSAGGLLGAVATIESGAATGTAFYVSRDGYLLTNRHVVADAAFVRVRLADGRNLVGEVLRTDRQRDVALLRTDPVGFDALALRRDEAQVGEEVYALGSPFGKTLSGTLTRGVVSARRVLEGVPFLQSDVAVNPGNSGGPLIDANGRVIGIAQLRGGEGIGLFIPIEDAVDRLGLAVWANPSSAQAKPAP